MKGGGGGGEGERWRERKRELPGCLCFMLQGSSVGIVHNSKRLARH